MRNIHVISHTHWDREWYLPFQLFRLKLVQLVDGLLDILENDRDYKYFMLDGQTIILDDYLLMRHEKEPLLREYIRKGRILIGPWHILPDMFLVGPEAHIRNLLQGERTARKFGQKMMIGYMPDSFGHVGQVPQILRGFGIEVASLWRGVEDEASEFWWQAPDGSRVLLAYLPEGYGNGADLPANDRERFAGMIGEKGDILAKVSSTKDFLIMYGTDHMEPPRNTSEAIAYADEMLRNTHVIHSTLPQYVAAIQASIKKLKVNLPTISGELRSCKRMHLLPGVLSTRIWIKQRNHACQTLLEKWVEPFSTFAELMTFKNPIALRPSRFHQSSSLVRQTWRILMENHPHDSICGCSIDQVHNEMKVRFDQVEQIGEEITKQSLEAIAASINTDRGDNPVSQIPPKGNLISCIVVFNPSSFSRTDVVTATIDLPSNITNFDLLDENGTSLNYQMSGKGSHEIVNMTLDSRGLKSAFGNISDGQAAGMTVQDLIVTRLGTEVFIESIMANGGEPNLAKWQAGRTEIEGYFADPSITTYHLRVRSNSSAQIIITVPDVPALGYRTLWVSPRSGEEKHTFRLGFLGRALMPLARFPILQKLVVRDNYAKPLKKIENEFFSVEAVDDGTLTILDIRNGITYQGLNRFYDGGDNGDEYNYAPPEQDRWNTPHLKRVSHSQGSIQQSLQLDLELSTSRSISLNRQFRSKEHIIIPIRTTITLTKNVPRVDIHTSIDNHARDHRLRVHFPAPFASGTGDHDGHFEVVERKIGVPAFDDTWVEQPRPEVPQRAFTSVSDGKTGLTLANRGLTEVEVITTPTGNVEIALTLLRCVGWLSRDDFSMRKGHAGPFLETPGAQMPGRWEFDYSIIPHTGNWRKAFSTAYAFETPFRLVSSSLHSGTLPPSSSFVKVDPVTFVISAIKPSEDGTGWLVRGYNITGEAIHVTIKPWEFFKKVNLINLVEEDQSTLIPGIEGQVIFPVRGHEIVTVLFKNDNPR